MIRVADSRADFERCAEICSAVEPDRVLTADEAGGGSGTSYMVEGNASMRAVDERLGSRALPAVFVVSGIVS